jgi:hypothetical protein
MVPVSNRSTAGCGVGVGESAGAEGEVGTTGAVGSGEGGGEDGGAGEVGLGDPPAVVAQADRTRATSPMVSGRGEIVVRDMIETPFVNDDRVNSSTLAER